MLQPNSACALNKRFGKCYRGPVLYPVELDAPRKQALAIREGSPPSDSLR